jgi:phosphoribosylaminoimidazole-succinocarboxamide synthase
VEIKEMLIDNGTEKIYATDQEGQVVVEFQNYFPFSGSGKKERMDGKAEANNAICCALYEYLGSYNVPTHLARKIDGKSFLAKRVEMIPIVVSIWNVASSELSKRFDLEEDKLLEYPIVEMYYKNEKLKVPMINEYHAYALGLCDRKEMGNILRIATKINAILKSFFDRKNFKLVNFQIEFGRHHNQIVLADKLNLDNMTLWGINGKGGYDKFDIRGSNRKKNYKELQERLVKEFS